MFDNVKLVHETFPDKHLIFTEGCADSFKAEELNDWRLGELYGRSMINDFNDGTVGWTDWNVLLDENGGPNHVENFCFAPVHADTKTGELIYTNSYYYIGHFSKFVRPGARRIASSPSRSPLLSTAFVNPDGKVSVVVMNKSDQKITYYPLAGRQRRRSQQLAAFDSDARVLIIETCSAKARSRFEYSPASLDCRHSWR